MSSAKKLKGLEGKLDSVEKNTEIIMKTTSAILEKTETLVELSKESLYQHCKLGQELKRAIFDANEAVVPPSFIILPYKLFQDNKQKDMATEAEGWLNSIMTFASQPLENIENAVSSLLHDKTLYFYLIDEYTEMPVKDSSSKPVYPIEIQTTSEFIKKSAPYLKVAFKTLSIFNSASKIVNMIGYPTPSLNDATMSKLKSSLVTLSSESSVAAFSILQSNVSEAQTGDGKESITRNARGADLRELQRFFAEYDEDNTFSGMIRVCGHDGWACWTTTQGRDALEEKLKEERDALLSTSIVSASSIDPIVSHETTMTRAVGVVDNNDVNSNTVTSSKFSSNNSNQIVTTSNRTTQPANIAQSSQALVTSDTHFPSSHSHRDTSMNMSSMSFNTTISNNYNNNLPDVDCHRAWEILNNASYQLDPHKLQQLLDYYGIYNEEDLVYISEATLNILSLCLKHAGRNKFLRFKPAQVNAGIEELKTTIWILLQTPDNHKSANDSQILYTSLSNYGIFDSSHLSGLNEAMVTKLAVHLKEAPKNDFLHDCKLLLSQPRLKPSSPRLLIYSAFIIPNSIKIIPTNNTAYANSRLSLTDTKTTGSHSESNSASVNGSGLNNSNDNKLTLTNSDGPTTCNIS